MYYLAAALFYLASTVSAHPKASAKSQLENQSRGASDKKPCYYSNFDGNKCGVYGRLAMPSYIGKPFSNVTDVLGCDYRCTNNLGHHGRRHYESLYYDSATSTCRCFDSKLEDQKFVPNKSSTKVFMDRPCFLCRFTCPQPIQQSVIEDGGFENEDLASNTPWAIYGANLTSPGYQSDKAGYLAFGDKTPSQSGANAIFSQTIHTCINSTYVFSFVYKWVFQHDTVGNFNYIEIDMGNIQERNIVPTIEQNNTWVTYSTTFQPTDDSYDDLFTDVNLYPWISTNTQVYLDNVQVYPIS